MPLGPGLNVSRALLVLKFPMMMTFPYGLSIIVAEPT